jgi:hypothetical protein
MRRARWRRKAEDWINALLTIHLFTETEGKEEDWLEIVQHRPRVIANN